MIQYNARVSNEIFLNVITSLEDLVDGLAQNGLDNYTHLLTGYIGSASFLKRVALLVTALKAKNPNLIYGTLLLRSAIPNVWP